MCQSKIMFRFWFAYAVANYSEDIGIITIIIIIVYVDHNWPNFKAKTRGTDPSSLSLFLPSVFLTLSRDPVDIPIFLSFSIYISRLFWNVYVYADKSLIAKNQKKIAHVCYSCPPYELIWEFSRLFLYKIIWSNSKIIQFVYLFCIDIIQNYFLIQLLYKINHRKEIFAIIITTN